MSPMTGSSMLKMATTAMPRTLALVPMLVFLLVPAQPLTAQNALPDLGKVAGDYIIGKQDLLQISVFDLEALNQTVRVQDDGTISLPLIGNLHADGLTRSGLEKAIADHLSPKFVIDPQVSVFVKSYESKKVTILGAVKIPGSFEVIGSRTLLEVISLAGGALKEQAVKTIQVIRHQEDGASKTITVDFAALENGDPAANIPIQGGDIIQFPVDDLLYIYVNGAVRVPGVFRVKRSDPVTVLRAVTMAGGVNDRGTGRRVKVLRSLPDGTTRAFPVDLKRIQKGKENDFVLQNNDVVIVPEAYF
jgi:polysaccharide biosynthesis/export protein